MSILKRSGVDIKDPHVQIFFGPMKSGKSHALATFAMKYAPMVPILVVKPSIDTTSPVNEIASRTGIKVPCVGLNEDGLNSLEIMPGFVEARVILIDESQFFQGLCTFVRKWFTSKILILGSLDADDKQNKFGEIWDCIPYARHVEKLTALCEICCDGTAAVATICLGEKKNQVEIDDRSNSKYRAVCELHVENRN